MYGVDQKIPIARYECVVKIPVGNPRPPIKHIVPPQPYMDPFSGPLKNCVRSEHIGLSIIKTDRRKLLLKTAAALTKNNVD